MFRAIRRFFSVECCHVRLRPKNRTGGVKDGAWPHCINRECVAYGEGKASASSRPGIPWLQWRWGRD